MLKNGNTNNPFLCNCRRKNESPFNGECLIKNVVYQTTVKKTENELNITYIITTEEP